MPEIVKSNISPKVSVINKANIIVSHEQSNKIISHDSDTSISKAMRNPRITNSKITKIIQNSGYTDDDLILACVMAYGE